MALKPSWLLPPMIVWLCLAVVSPAHADRIRWDFEGEVSSNTINEASRFSGFIVYESDTPDRFANDASRGAFFQPVTDFWLRLDGFAATLDDFSSSTISVGNAAIGDSHRVFLPSARPVPRPKGFIQFQWTIELPPTAFSNSGLPESPPLYLADSTVALSVGGGFVRPPSMNGTLTSLSSRPIPEPHSRVIFAAGLFIVGLAARLGHSAG